MISVIAGVNPDVDASAEAVHEKVSVSIGLDYQSLTSITQTTYSPNIIIINDSREL